MMRRIQELTRVSRVVTADLDRESPSRCVITLRSCRGWRKGLTVAWPR